ncbi:MAG: ATP-binding protein [Acholeplasmatales bacterium]|jgi:predicted AAA+ superfamily ATPase|nr:ATP-binding protein [Acholeplasmataceae bacterium]MCK9289827.1 ATP-binding protein [Acholeplasmataceae bacterium]MCK9428221.1 ATP-binding protein [Acholeplasmataceae bacterium]MDY0115581.1 ATP-binding protein [Acholeplasmatales bacterium]
MIIREDYLAKIRPFYNKNIIKIITGIRRSGKSTLLMQIINEFRDKGVDENNIIHLRFDEYSNKKLLNPNELSNYINSKIKNKVHYYLFLDEIQEVEQFEKIVNELNNKGNIDLYLTGSNSTMLASEFATYLTGRYVAFEIFPFSFKEFVEYKGNNNYDKLFLEYINFGGFPQTLIIDDEFSKKNLLNDLYNSLVIRDIVEKYNVRDVSLLDSYLKYLLNTMGSLFSATSISNYLKNEKRNVSRETLYNYRRYAEDVYFIYALSRFDIQGKKVLQTNDKLYVNDQGFRNIFFNNQKDIEKILENVVYFELLRRGFEVYVGAVGKKEIDFVAIKDGEKKYIQVTYILALEKTIEREFGVYKEVLDNFPKYVISTDKFNMSRDGITHLNIIDFLLNPLK